ncbi:MAG TPA: hypothetical protein PK213_06305 [Deltaproteobacteria bacterium]|nr:hypothetical protein [Deltaproteobacteria bacterium]
MMVCISVMTLFTACGGGGGGGGGSEPDPVEETALIDVSVTWPEEASSVVITLSQLEGDFAADGLSSAAGLDAEAGLQVYTLSINRPDGAANGSETAGSIEVNASDYEQFFNEANVFYSGQGGNGTVVHKTSKAVKMKPDGSYTKESSQCFWFENTLDDPPTVRYWSKFNKNKWEESLPDGTSVKYRVIERITLDGSDGTIVQKNGADFQVFIPDQDAAGDWSAWLRYRENQGGGWSWLGVLTYY